MSIHNPEYLAAKALKRVIVWFTGCGVIGFVVLFTFSAPYVAIPLWVIILTITGWIWADEVIDKAEVGESK